MLQMLRDWARFCWTREPYFTLKGQGRLVNYPEHITDLYYLHAVCLQMLNHSATMHERLEVSANYSL